MKSLVAFAIVLGLVISPSVAFTARIFADIAARLESLPF